LPSLDISRPAAIDQRIAEHTQRASRAIRQHVVRITDALAVKAVLDPLTQNGMSGEHRGRDPNESPGRPSAESPTSAGDGHQDQQQRQAEDDGVPQLVGIR
jgi:hypothetical protein